MPTVRYPRRKPIQRRAPHAAHPQHDDIEGLHVTTACIPSKSL